MRHKFPEAYQIFKVVDQEKIIALTMTVRVNDHILYNFLCGDLPEYRVYSPVVMLMDRVYQHCQRENIRILDLGISLDGNGVHKPSLSRFKKNIGGKECLKMTYEITFR
ncbi:GNAT family N-acetyltransferase [Dyadobacter sp. CY351]|uniref:GNAT family N-acetyltransferase n=1 Tax=Dyadobacter sp. CY351 TaxID=2909337 RepID=UPI001F1D93C9|nr:GNAT family N-acetyltransferase [Dyadobacter sp. CY351]MCF2516642.1 GNAT family N-acetyltransferase [Dyadobacter sp. CY351]